MNWIVILRASTGLALFITALVLAVRLALHRQRASAVLALLVFWFIHGVAYYTTTLALFIVLDTFPRELALAINWWSTILRYQIIIALAILLFIFPRGLLWKTGS